MQSFLDRFYDEVSDCLADPSTSKRFPKSKRYSELYRVQERIFSRLLNSAGQDSDLGRTEATITLVEDQDTYVLPPAFRQFIAFEYRTNGDPRLVEARLGSLATYDEGCGVRILGGGRGMQINPRPSNFLVGDWTLIYRKGPIRLHNSTLASLNGDGDEFTSTTPATDGGELVLLDNYYAGSVVRIYSASTGAPQERVVASSAVSGAQVVFTLALPLDPIPTGTIKYEIVPELSESVDGLYAYDVALVACSRRMGFSRRAGLMQDREMLWRSAKGMYNAAVADRQPERSRPPNPYEDPVYD